MKLDKDFGHIDHAYCTTSYSSQGKTVDNVFISQPSATFVATDAKQFYVSVSRGRDAVKIYTDDKEALLSYASNLGNRQSAIETVENKTSHLEYVQQLERANYTDKNSPIPSKETKEINRVKINRDYEPEI
jgi:ATP-dependent exoDNAse (exonuclease V) alpha subunit